jgi:HEPN domain-containing protein
LWPDPRAYLDGERLLGRFRRLVGRGDVTVPADLRRLHVEGRYNYEALRTGSAFVGVTGRWGDSLELGLTPMVGGVFGALAGVAPALRLSVTWWKLDLSSESEIVFDLGNAFASFFYDWTELGLSPVSWLRFGAERPRVDREAAVRLRVYLHAQQAVEKYLKALLEELCRPIPRTHILRDLLALLLPYYPLLRSFQRGLKFLTRFAVDIRYPSDWATKRQARSALRWAGEVRTACRMILGIGPARSRRHRSIRHMA